MTALLTVPVIGIDIFKCGDPMTPENMYTNKSGLQCRTCALARSRAFEKVMRSQGRLYGGRKRDEGHQH